MPLPVRANVDEAERVMCDSTPVALSFLGVWLYSQGRTSLWQFTYTGSGTETPSLEAMTRHKTMLISALPEYAKFMSIGLLQREETSRYQMTVQRVNRNNWLTWAARRKAHQKPVPTKYLETLGIFTHDNNSTL